MYIAYDRDEAGDKAAATLADELRGMGIEGFRVLFPKGMDANEYALKVTPADKSLGVLINKAQWLGKGTTPKLAAVPRPIEQPAAKEEIEMIEQQPEPEPVPSLAAKPQPPARPEIDVPVEIHLDDELLNRCLVLSVNEDREQTQAIHRVQREAQTLEGLLRKRERDDILAVHRNAQRLLKPVAVVNPFAPELTFLDSQTRTRRDHTKYLTLIRSIALLHQYQRPHKTVEHKGRTVEYIEVTLNDIAVANRLAHEVLGRSLDELPPQTRRLLLMVDSMVSAECERQHIERSDYRFSRRDVRAFTGWGDTQLKIHLHRLEEMEYLLVHRGGRGQSFVYELLFTCPADNRTAALEGLIDVEKLIRHEYDEKKSGAESRLSGPSRPQVGQVSGLEKTAPEPMPMRVPQQSSRTIAENTYTARANGHYVVGAK